MGQPGGGFGERRDVADVLARLRADHPDAVLGAIGSESGPVEVPPALRFPGSPWRDEAPQGLAAVHPDDRPAALRAYGRALQAGMAEVTIRGASGQRLRLHLLDVRDEHGIVLSVAYPDDDGEASDDDVHDVVAPIVTWARLDGAAVVLEVDDAGEALFGWPAEDVVGRPAISWIHPDDHAAAVENWLEVLASPGQKRRYRCRHLRADGSHVWVDVTNRNRLDDPAHGDVVSEMVDVSDEMRIHEQLAEREQVLTELTDALPVGVVLFDGDGRTVHENLQLAAIVGAGGLAGLRSEAAAADRPALDDALAQVRAGRTPAPLEVHLEGDRVCQVTLRPLSSGGGLACVHDVTEAVRLRRELEVRATFDALTSCFSRSAILTALQHVVDDGPGAGVVFVDLDRFKPVNDELGHAAGDELLARVGARLREAVREVDLVGRLGGDEFLVVCPGVASLADVEAIAERVTDAVAQPLEVADVHLVRPRASIGVAWAPAGSDPAALVARADAAMYEAKRRTRPPNWV